jgi:hypothetical protein
MTDKPENQVTANTQPVYDPPQALRMGSVRAGTGLCVNQGSSDVDYCSIGNNATGDGCDQGISAGGCAGSGNSADSCVTGDAAGAD